MQRCGNIFLAACALILGGIAAAPRPAAAHPHVWIDASVVVEFKNRKIVALDETWTFDEVFSEDTLQDLDKDHTSAAFRQGLVTLAGKEQDALADESYFTHFYIGSIPSGAPAIKGLRIDLVGNRLVYRFTAPVDPPVDPTKAPFGFSLYDHSFFVDVEPVKTNPVLELGQGTLRCTQTRKDDPDHAYYFEQNYPSVVWIACQ